MNSMIGALNLQFPGELVCEKKMELTRNIESRNSLDLCKSMTSMSFMDLFVNREIYKIVDNPLRFHQFQFC